MKSKLKNMKLLKIMVSLTVTSTLLLGCGNTSIEKKNKQMPAKSHIESEVASYPEAIMLDDGRKWNVNEEMKPFIQEAENILNLYRETKSSYYQNLADQLKVQNSDLIKSCTMKGASHDELHKWLYPHIKLIDALARAESIEEAEVIITSIQGSFNTYHQYFQ